MLNKGFEERKDGVRQIKYDFQDELYSNWHRSLGKELYVINIDCVEYRIGRGIVAFIAVTGRCQDENHIINSKKYIWERTKLEREIMVLLAAQFNVPSYYVIHDIKLSIFHVHKCEDLNRFKAMNADEYARFIRAL
jgi:hypothetical protein